MNNTKIKNYTSQVPVERTVFLIEAELVSIGANKIEKTYKDGFLNGIVFSINLPDGTGFSYKIPAHVDAAHEILRQIPAYRKKPKAWLEAQAKRTSWKIIYVWICSQIAMIQLNHVQAMQVFLPFLYDRVRGRTFYELIQGQGFQMLTDLRQPADDTK
jgi:hypothetical protein